LVAAFLRLTPSRHFEVPRPIACDGRKTASPSQRSLRRHPGVTQQLVTSLQVFSQVLQAQNGMVEQLEKPG
jgi:hypothetical protein